MSWLEIILLGVVQGITEFLPVSSSGHLVVAAELMVSLGASRPTALLEVEIVLHLGTLAAIFVYFRRRILRLFSQDRRALPLLVVATLPTIAAVLALKLLMKDYHALESPLIAGLMFPVTAAMPIFSSRKLDGVKQYPEMTYRDALLIGSFQALAILPGVSRSGSTIVAGLLVGLRRDSAATFAFLLAIPAIGGAGVLQIWEMIQRSGSSTPTDQLALGAFTAMIVGLAALAAVVRIVESGKLVYFAFWLIPLGIAVTSWQLFR